MLPAHMHFGDWDWSALRSAAVGVAMAEQYVDPTVDYQTWYPFEISSKYI